jgi:hypothetical protein
MVISHDLLLRLMPHHLFVDPESEMRDLLSSFEAADGEAFLEIGTHKGFASAAIALAFPDARVVTVELPDPLQTLWDPLPRSLVGQAHRDLGVAQRIEQRFMDHADLWLLAARGEVYDVVFIDGDHSMEAVFRDLILAADLLRGRRGVLLLHDYTGADEPNRRPWTIPVQQAVDRFLAVRPFRKRRLSGLLVALEIGSFSSRG